MGYDIIISMENENNVGSKQQISTPVAIIIAGVLIMVGIIMTRGGGATSAVTKTLSEQVGVSKTSMAACIKDTDLEALNTNIEKSVNDAIAEENRGTPYSVVIGLNGVKTDIRGADSYANVKKIVDDAMVGIVLKPYTRNIALSEPTDHTKGSIDAKVTIIEYSDFACPYCKIFHPTMEKIVKENNGNVRWIYRHYPIKAGSFEKAVASNCVAEIKGNDAFWKYSDLLFGLIKTQNDSVPEQL